MGPAVRLGGRDDVVVGDVEEGVCMADWQRKVGRKNGKTEEKKGGVGGRVGEEERENWVEKGEKSGGERSEKNGLISVCASQESVDVGMWTGFVSVKVKRSYKLRERMAGVDCAYGSCYAMRHTQALVRPRPCV